MTGKVRRILLFLLTLIVLGAIAFALYALRGLEGLPLIGGKDKEPVVTEAPEPVETQAPESVPAETPEIVVAEEPESSAGVSGEPEENVSSTLSGALHTAAGDLRYKSEILAPGSGGDADSVSLGHVYASKGKIRFLALLDTLEYLRRGGRISNVSAALGTLLAIKPVVTCTDGKIVVMDKPRGLKSGRSIIANLIREDGGFDFDRPLCIGYTGNSDKPARQFLDSCPDLWEGKGEVPISSIGATIGTHAGPGGFLLAYFGKNA